MNRLRNVGWIGFVLVATALPGATTASAQSVNGATMTREDLLRVLGAPPAEERVRGFKSRNLMPHEAQDVEATSVYLNIQFESDSADLGSEAQAQLAEVAGVLRELAASNQSFGLAGHTDASGTEAYNLDLSKRRAEAVKSYLLTNFGVDGSQFFTNGDGEARPLPGHDPLAAENRRVEIFNLGTVTQ